jgi:hypothetical protein
MLISKKHFDYMLMENIIVVSINLYDKKLLTLGIEQKKLGIESNQTDISPYLKDLKEMAVNLGLKIFS